jgi:hypothetical protein
VRVAKALFTLASLAVAMPAAAAPPGIAECAANAEKGQAERDAGRYRSAERALDACANAACPSAIRQDCMSWLNDLLGSSPTVVFVVHDDRGADLEDVVVLADGEVLTSHIDGRPVRVDPGKHEVVFQSPHRAAVRMPLLVHTAVKDRVVTVQLGPRDDAPVETPSAASPAPSPPVSTTETPRTKVPVQTLLLGAGGIAALTTAGYLWLSARADLDGIEKRPCAAARTCSASEVSSVRTRLIVGDVVAGVGLAALGLAVWTWVARDRSGSAALVLVPPGGAHLVARF